MAFNPLNEKGIPLEDQLRPWDELNVHPYDKSDVHPYTRTRIILMNGIEVEAAIFKHQLARHCTDAEMKREIAFTRRIEQQQQKMVNWLVPGSESALEVTLGYEQVAVDLTAWLAQTESSSLVKAALDYALLEDFDHLYRYANLYEMLEGGRAENIIGSGLTEVFPGRPTIKEHQHPYDTLRDHVNAKSDDFLTQLHILTIVAAEQQTMNYYMNVGNRFRNHLARGLYAEIAMIEEQHVTHYESLADPSSDWFELAALHEYNECWLYYSCMETESDERIRHMWEFHLNCEVEHLRQACRMMREYGRKDPEKLLPAEMPEPLMVFQSNTGYVRNVLSEEVDFTTDGMKVVEGGKAPRRYKEVQQRLNSAGAPSQRVVEQHIERSGQDYRLEIEGPHPVERFRRREVAVA